VVVVTAGDVVEVGFVVVAVDVLRPVILDGEQAATPSPTRRRVRNAVKLRALLVVGTMGLSKSSPLAVH
jgi:hypothetical protein